MCFVLVLLLLVWVKSSSLTLDQPDQGIKIPLAQSELREMYPKTGLGPENTGVVI